LIKGLEPREPLSMWFALEVQDLSFTKTAPFMFENEAILDASPERVFEIIATGENQPTWFKDFVGVRWTSPPPNGVGSERDVELKLLTASERFLAWEPGKRLTFTMHRMTLPLVEAMVEDMVFEPIGADRTRLLWRAHYRPRAFMRPFHPILRVVFGQIFQESTRGLAAYVAAHKTRA
jgi:uncharacterized protein YndB with AHSA1/START domain